MTNTMNFSYMTDSCQDVLQSAIEYRKARAPRPQKAEESFWELRKKRRKEWMDLLKELDETKAAAKKMAKMEYYIRQSSETVRTGAADHELNEDVLAMQIFSSLKMGVLLESFMNKKGKV